MRAPDQANLTVSVIVSLLVLALVSSSCEDASDSIRNWGMRERGERILDLSDEDIARLKRDLKLSEDRAVEFEKNLRGLLQEQSIQGDLAWKIGKLLFQTSTRRVWIACS